MAASEPTRVHMLQMPPKTGLWNQRQYAKCGAIGDEETKIKAIVRSL